ncbi:hypothetical protein [Sporichthya polymorpha]|uniref:hypothetical protein n=1 Tax=Sporichthya polymorpha TaxID=35751 RepID=UPI0012EC22DF|nr:hypothetical protein [Sporichthya polymorpha]
MPVDVVRAEAHPETRPAIHTEPAPRPRGHRRAPKRRMPIAVPAAAGAAVAVTAVGGVTLGGVGGSTGGVALESVAGAGAAPDVQRVVVSERATRDQMRAVLGGKAANQARVRAKALRDQRLAVAAAQRLAALQRACGYNLYAQKNETLNAEQQRNARIIIDVAQRMGLPPRAAVIAIATALQESYLKNLRGGHLDSAGLFQQRPSAGWGSYSQVTDPNYSARKFYTELTEVRGWHRLPLTVAAQDVQVSAFPNAYARWERMAAQLVSSVLKVPVDSLNCTPLRST